MDLQCNESLDTPKALLGSIQKTNSMKFVANYSIGEKNAILRTFILQRRLRMIQTQMEMVVKKGEQEKVSDRARGILRNFYAGTAKFVGTMKSGCDNKYDMDVMTVTDMVFEDRFVPLPQTCDDEFMDMVQGDISLDFEMDDIEME